MLKIVIIGTDNEKTDSLIKEIEKRYSVEIFQEEFSSKLSINLQNTLPQIVVYHVAEGVKGGQIKQVVDLLEEYYSINPICKILIGGDISTDIKKWLTDTEIKVSGNSIKKIVHDFSDTIGQVITKNSDMIRFLTHLFAPHLVGHYDSIGFDQLISEGFDREEILSQLGELEKRMNTISNLLSDENRNLLETAVRTYRDNDLATEMKDSIREAFYFQFTSLSSLDNFSDERQYNAEKQVISTLWESVIAFARENGDGIIFGCSKTEDIIKLKIAINQPFSLKKINKRTKLYKILSLIEPYGDIAVTSGDEQILIGNPQTDLIETEGLTFEFFFKVIIPARRRRGLKSI